MPVPNSFANVTTSIPLSQLDANFNTPITLGNTAIQLGNTVTTLNNMTLANVTVSSGNVTITNVSVTTANVTTANIATANVTTSQILNYGTANQVQFLNASKALTGSANLTFDGTTLTPHTLTVSTGVLTVPAGSSTAPSITTSGDTNTGIFFPAADTVAIGTGGTERLRVDSAGNAGLGVTPSGWTLGRVFELGARGNALWYAGSTTDLRLNCNVYYDGSYRYGANGQATYYSMANGSHAWHTAASGTAGNAITFTQAMTLDASGNLGIGTTSTAGYKLVVSDGTTFSVVHAGGGASYYGAISNNPVLFITNNLERARITSAGEFLVGTTTSGGYQMAVSGATTNGVTGIKLINTATTSSSGNLNMFVAGSSYGSFGVAANSGWLCVEGANNLAIGPTGAGNVTFVTNGSERMRLLTSGILQIPTAFSTTTGSAANLFIDSAGGFYRSTSSIKYKTDVQDTAHGLADVMQLRAVTYRGKGEFDGDTIFGGLIAEEVHEAGLTEFVQYAEDGTPDALHYGNMVSLAFKAIQELNAKVEAQAAEIAALKGNA